jgi:putative transposase
MKKKRFNEIQIVSILKEGEADMPIAQLSRKYGIGESTYFA